VSDSGLFQQRHVGSARTATPLLVPSFSSRGFQDPIGVVKSYSPYTSRSCLISAFDVHYGVLPSEWRDLADFIVLDSGGYEAYASSELSSPRSWDLGKYKSVIESLGAGTTYLLVTFDYNLRENPYERQLAEASALCDKYPQYDWDFLVKPEGPSHHEVNIDAVVSRLDTLQRFAAIGFVEDELGSSIWSRAISIRRLRRRLIEQGLDIPIHIFGCLDPLRIPVYVLSGADIFDGLEWLRSAFTEAGLVRFSSLAMNDGDIDMPDAERGTRAVLQNIRILTTLEVSLRKLLRSGNISDLDMPERSKVILRGFTSRLGDSDT